MRRRRAAILALFLLAISTFVSLWRLSPRLDPRTTPVSLENLKRHVKVIAAEPHPVGSAANQRVRDYILAELQALGLSPQVQAGVVTSPRGRVHFVENIVCRISAATAKTDAAGLLVSHYDSHPRAPGAGDDANAVAGIIEVARLLVADAGRRRDIVLLFTDGEEYGLLGAQMWVRDHPDLLGCRVVANFEARGSSGPAIMFETAGAPVDLFFDGYARRSPHPVTSSLASPVYERMPNGTDFTVFKLAGMAGLNFAFIGGVQNYHGPQDTPENLSDRSLLHQAAQMYDVARYFASAEESAFAANVGNGDLKLVYFDVLALGIVAYPSHLTGPLAIVSAVVAGAGIFRLRPRAAYLIGALARLMTGALIVVALTVLCALVPVDTLALRWSHLVFAAAGLLTFSLLPFAGASSPRRQRHTTVVTIALLAFGALATGFAFPPGSYVLLVPATALGLASCMPIRWRGPAFACAAALSTIILLPLAWLVMQAMTMRLLPAPAVILLLTSWLWRPSLAPLLRARWRIASALIILAGVCFAVPVLA